MYTPRTTGETVGISLAAALMTACGNSSNLTSTEPTPTEPENPDVTLTTDLPDGGSARSDHGDLTVTVDQTGSDITLEAPKGDLSAPTLSGDSVDVNALTGTVAKTTGNNATMTFGDSATVHFVSGHDNAITGGMQPSNILNISDMAGASDSFFSAANLNIGGPTGAPGNVLDATSVNGNGKVEVGTLTAGTTVQNASRVFVDFSVACDSTIVGQDIDLTIGLESQGTTRYVINNPAVSYTHLTLPTICSV